MPDEFYYSILLKAQISLIHATYSFHHNVYCFENNYLQGVPK